MAASDAEMVKVAGADPDAAIPLRLAEGAPEAAGELFQRFGPGLLSLAVSWFADDRQSAEDVMVQALAKATCSIRRFDPRRSTFATWLYGIARREIHNEFRQRRRMKSVPATAQMPLDSATHLSSGQDVAAAVAARLDARRQVSELAAVLSRTEFDVLALSCIDQLSAREIGQVVGRSERAVHSLLHRARAKARERLVHDE